MKIFIHQRRNGSRKLKYLTNDEKDEKDSQFMAIPK